MDGTSSVRPGRFHQDAEGEADRDVAELAAA